MISLVRIPIDLATALVASAFGGFSKLVDWGVSSGLFGTNAVVVIILLSLVALAVLLFMAVPRYVMLFSSASSDAKKTFNTFAGIMQVALEDFGEEYLAWLEGPQLEQMDDILATLYELQTIDTIHYGVAPDNPNEKSIFLEINKNRQHVKLADDSSNPDNKEYVEDPIKIYDLGDEVLDHEDAVSLPTAVRENLLGECLELWKDLKEHDPVKVIKKQDIRPLTLIAAFDKFKITFPFFCKDVVIPRLELFKHIGIEHIPRIAKHVVANGALVMDNSPNNSDNFTADEILSSHFLCRVGHRTPKNSFWKQVVGDAVGSDVAALETGFKKACWNLKEDDKNFLLEYYRYTDEIDTSNGEMDPDKWYDALAGLAHMNNTSKLYGLKMAVNDFHQFLALANALVDRFGSNAPDPNAADPNAALLGAGSLFESAMKHLLDSKMKYADDLNIFGLYAEIDELQRIWSGVADRMLVIEESGIQQHMLQTGASSDGSCENQFWYDGAASDYQALLNAVNCSVYLQDYVVPAKKNLNIPYLNPVVADRFFPLFMRHLTRSYLSKKKPGGFYSHNLRISFDNHESISAYTSRFWHSEFPDKKTALKHNYEKEVSKVRKEFNNFFGCDEKIDENDVPTFIPGTPVNFNVANREKWLNGISVRIKNKASEKHLARSVASGAFKAKAGGDVLELRILGARLGKLYIRVLTSTGGCVVVGLEKNLIVENNGQDYQHDLEYDVDLQDDKPKSGIFMLTLKNDTDVIIQPYFYPAYYVTEGGDGAEIRLEGKDNAEDPAEQVFIFTHA